MSSSSREHDEAVISTADDAIRAKLSCVERGYYDDPFVHAMARGAAGLVAKSSHKMSASASGSMQGRHPAHRGAPVGRGASSGTEPIIRRGTHARVKAIDRAVDAFLSLPLSAPDASDQRVARQVVVLGAGRDTAFLRHRFGKDGVLGDDVRWYEVDHPSVIQQKAQIWLPRCIPDGYGYSYDMNLNTGNSYAIDITSQTGERGNEKGTSQYHLIGHDLRTPPDALFDALAHPMHGYDRSLPTLFVLECVMMYLPEEATWDLLRCLAESPTPSRIRGLSHPFVAVAMYDPIPSNDRFGQLMISNLQKAGVTGRKGRGRGEADDGRSQLSLEKTRTLSDQLAKISQCGFDTAVGCDMMAAYDHGVISVDDRRRAARCEMLDELEEFVLLMKHYCLVVGVCSKCENEVGNKIGVQLCSVGDDSLIGFREGHCTVVNRSRSPN